MRRIVSFVCAASLLGTSLVAAQPPLTNHPIVGAWKLNVARSTGATVRLVVTRSPSGQFDMTAMGLSARFRVDGKEHPTFGLKASWTQPGPRAWDAVAKERGRIASTDHYVLSADERTLTITTEIPGRRTGTAERLVLTRLAGGPGLAGVWQGRRSVGDATAEYAIESGELRIHMLPFEERWRGRLDGRDYPWFAAGAESDRFTASGRVVAPRTVEIVLKEKGSVFHHATLSVSDDGQTLQIDQIHGASAEAPEKSRLVYERR
jgi:hypothetical protein